MQSIFTPVDYFLCPYVYKHSEKLKDNLFRFKHFRYCLLSDIVGLMFNRPFSARSDLVLGYKPSVITLYKLRNR